MKIVTLFFLLIICFVSLFAVDIKDKSIQIYSMKKNALIDNAFSGDNSMRTFNENIQNNEQEIVNFVKNCNFNKFSAMGATIQQLENCLFVSTNCNEPFVNGVIYSSLKDFEVEDTVEKISQYFAEKKVPYCWWSEVSSEPVQLQEILEKNGLFSDVILTGMILNTDNVIKPKNAEELEIVIVSNKEELLLWSKMLSEAYECSEDFSNFFTNLLNEVGLNGPWYHLMGMKDDKIVCTGSILFTDKGAYIYNISSIKNEKYVSNITYALIQLAKAQSTDLIALMSPEYVVPFYLGLGFKEVAYFHYYVKK
ncbi:MAG: hypothetical protein ACFFG0_17885 [Candidatus Thorarchaeota archaeon]